MCEPRLGTAVPKRQAPDCPAVGPCSGCTGVQMFYGNRQTRLDVAALGLEGRELEIAQIIAEETEAQRATELAQLPPPDPGEEAKNGLLRGALTAEGWRREDINAKPWEALLLLGDVHARCVQRSGLRLVEVIDFAMDKCRPSDVGALFWYGRWLEQLLCTVPFETALSMADEARKDARQSSGAAGRNKRWGPYRDAKSYAQQEWQRQRASYGGKKAPFARAMIAPLKQTFAVDDVTERTITEDWLRGL